jgi:hypothetical protein
LDEALARLPPLDGGPVRISLRSGLYSYRGRLLSGKARGSAVHAGTFLRKRHIVLDARLMEQPAELERILLHEVFHFVWMKLGNATRFSYEGLVAAEMRSKARGEMGWSAEWRKRALSFRDRRNRTRRWREYLCESFCDSAAWLFSGRSRHSELTLDAGLRQKRQQWFRAAGLVVRITI